VNRDRLACDTSLKSPYLVDCIQRGGGCSRRDGTEDDDRNEQCGERENPHCVPNGDEISDRVQHRDFREHGVLSAKYRDGINCLDFDSVIIVLHSFRVWPKRGSKRRAGGGVLLHWREEDAMSDGREEREEREKRREQEAREDREDLINRELGDQWEPERDES
jgi:hypothetical protein